MAAKNPPAPPPDTAQARAAIQRIHQRRRAADDPDLHHLEDDPAQVVAYVRTYRRVPPKVLDCDAKDVLLLIRYLRAQLDAEELSAIRSCRTLGWAWSRIARNIGATSPQAADQRMRRLQTAVDAARSRQDRAELNHRLRGRAWLAANAGAIHQAAAHLHRDRSALAVNEDATTWLECIEEILQEWTGHPSDADSMIAQFRLLGRAVNGHQPAAETALSAALHLAQLHEDACAR